jgi:membrane-associated phospholipid phosphatase
MSNALPEMSPPPEAPIHRVWTAYQRPVLLAGLVIGLIIFLVWLPIATRETLLVALMSQRALMVMLVLFGLIALSLVWSAGQRLDLWIFQLFNFKGYHPAWLDRSMWLATQLGNMLTAFFLAGLFFILNYRSLTVVIILGTLTLWLVVEIIKVLTDRARPFLTIEGTRVIGWRERGRSFPSGHTAQTFFLMTLFIHKFQIGLWGTIVLYAVAGLVGFTRMYVGAHYPRDVIGGAVLGSVWGLLAALLNPFWLGLPL